MTINIDTGSIHVAQRPSYENSLGKSFVGTINEYNDTTPSEAVVFPSVDRRLLLVEPNTMMVVTGYNLSNTTEVSFRKVLRSNGVPAQGTSACCPSVTVAHAVRLHSVELPCWVLDRCNPVFIIKTPGNHELDVRGDVVDIVVTAMAFPIQDVNPFGGCNCTPEEEAR